MAEPLVVWHTAACSSTPQHAAQQYRAGGMNQHVPQHKVNMAKIETPAKTMQTFLAAVLA
jgi:hypothetical protein